MLKLREHHMPHGCYLSLIFVVCFLFHLVFSSFESFYWIPKERSLQCNSFTTKLDL